MNMKNIIFVALVFLLFTFELKALNKSDIVGTWQTIDDESNQVRSLVELTIVKNKLYGTIVKLFPQPGELKNPVCDQCDGNNKNMPILGLQIIDGLTLKKNQWLDGNILDPNNGKNYDCKIWLEKGKLKVRGYIGFFYRTQEWLKLDPNETDNNHLLTD